MADLPTIRRLTPAGVENVHGELIDLYIRCYTAPRWSEGPDEIAAYAARIRTWSTADGFTGLIARDDDGTLAGTTYGWLGPPEIRGLTMPGIDHARVFHVGDLMVRPTHRRSGLGRRLLDELVAGRLPAILVTHPASDARRLYDTAGWRHTGTVTPPGSWSMAVYALEAS